MILICRFRRSLATAQTNRFALRLARNSAKTGHIVPLAGVYANGTLVVLLLGVRRGPTRRSAIAIPIPFEPKQEHICLAPKAQRCPQVRHGESALWRTSMRQRLWH